MRANDRAVTAGTCSVTAGFLPRELDGAAAALVYLPYSRMEAC